MNLTPIKSNYGTAFMRNYKIWTHFLIQQNGAFISKNTIKAKFTITVWLMKSRAFLYDGKYGVYIGSAAI